MECKQLHIFYEFFTSRRKEKEKKKRKIFSFDMHFVVLNRQHIVHNVSTLFNSSPFTNYNVVEMWGKSVKIYHIVQTFMSLSPLIQKGFSSRISRQRIKKKQNHRFNGSFV